MRETLRAPKHQGVDLRKGQSESKPEEHPQTRRALQTFSWKKKPDKPGDQRGLEGFEGAKRFAF